MRCQIEEYWIVFILYKAMISYCRQSALSTNFYFQKIIDEIRKPCHFISKHVLLSENKK